MIDKSKQYKTRDGREVRIYATDGAHGKVHGAMLTAEGWEHRTWNSFGRIVLCQEHEYDLIEVRPRIRRTVWLNVYNNFVWCHGSKIGADDGTDQTRLACVKVEIDCAEGDGL